MKFWIYCWMYTWRNKCLRKSLKIILEKCLEESQEHSLKDFLKKIVEEFWRNTWCKFLRKSQEKIVKILGKIIKEIPGSKSAIFLKKTFNDFEEFLYASQEEFLKSFDGILKGISNGFLLVEFFDDFHCNFNVSCRNARIIFYMVLSGKTYGKICKWKSMLVELEKPSEKFLDEYFKKLLKDSWINSLTESWKNSGKSSKGCL